MMDLIAIDFSLTKLDMNNINSNNYEIKMMQFFDE